MHLPCSMNMPAGAQQEAEQRERQQETAIETLESEHAERCSELAQRIGKYDRLHMSTTGFIWAKGEVMLVLIFVAIDRSTRDRCSDDGG